MAHSLMLDLDLYGQMYLETTWNVGTFSGSVKHCTKFGWEVSFWFGQVL